jgi:hypothetical protein
MKKNVGKNSFMRQRIVSTLLAVAVISGAAFWSPAAQMRSETGQIDFASLNREATLAMESLQNLQARRLAPPRAAEF